MVSFTGNTGVYLQYAHTRIRSILRRAGDPEITVDPEVRLEPAERALALELDSYAGVLAEVGATLEPHRLCGYLYELAQAFTSFYESCPVLKAEDPAVRASRLAFCQVTLDVLATGLGLLGITAPEQM
jgi:arginyl-tRNA synthetase